LQPLTPAYVLLWVGLQKLGAFGAVGLAVWRGLFSPLALGIAFFDLATAMLCAVMRRRLR
jgi:membrane protein implicated in regulation of membrane protease activity